MTIIDLLDIFNKNDIMQNAMNGKSPDPELMEWIGSDILKLSYIKTKLNEGWSKEKVAKFFGVTVEDIDKFVKL